MPLYLFKNVATNEVREIAQPMNSVHQYDGNDGTEIGMWVRVFTVPQAAFDTKADPFKPSDFAKVTEKKNIKVGDMMDVSAEMSEKRAKVAGEDPVKKKLFDDYQKKTGKKHLASLPTKIDTPRVTAEFGD